MADRDDASGVLGLVQAYVNTVDLQGGPEGLSDPHLLGAWLVARGLLEHGQTLSDGDLRNAVAVREAVRGVIAANTGGRVFPLDVAILNEAATASRLRARFGADGKARLEPEAGGAAGAMGRVVAALFTAMAEPDWKRLKLCGSPACRWAFYDQSRNRSSRWCSMASCGNRQKAKRFRERARSGA